MHSDEFLDDLHLRILRVSEDLRAIQQQLNCAAMQAPGDPELMEALCQGPELESLEVLKTALDQMRHFLWFYIQVITNESAEADQRQPIAKKPVQDTVISPRVAAAEKFRFPTEAALREFLAAEKTRKPN
ncbi:MAG TPA: hypothetical protein VEK33_17125 [Terriglobales bacterium]|nr:hypothetical protein [Terriglobales bacterium]